MLFVWSPELKHSLEIKLDIKTVSKNVFCLKSCFLYISDLKKLKQMPHIVTHTRVK